MKRGLLLILIPLLLWAQDERIPLRLGLGGDVSNWGYGGTVRSWLYDRVGLDLLVQRDWDGIEEGGQLLSMFNFSSSRRFSPYVAIGGGMTRIDLPEVGKGRNNGYLGYASLGAGGELFWGNQRHGLSVDAAYNIGKLSYRAKVLTNIGLNTTETIMKEVEVDPFTVRISYHVYLIVKSKEVRERERILREFCHNDADDFQWFDDNIKCPIHDNDNDGILNAADKCPFEAEDMDGFADFDGCPEWDNDGDGFVDSLDSCPNEVEDIDGFFDDDGCPETDYDNDGIADIIDKCPATKEIVNGYQDKDGCPEKDIDGDGVVDALDLCPRVVEDIDGFQDDDGCPEDDDPLYLDSDNDGVVDIKDRCPDEMETKNFFQDDDGCADTIHIADSIVESTALGTVHFALNSYKLRRSDKPTLDTLVSYFKQRPDKMVLIEGYTDDLGSSFYNKRIAKRRASAVMAYFTQMGIKPERIVIEGLGDENPRFDNKTDLGRAMNRRVEVKVLE